MRGGGQGRVSAVSAGILLVNDRIFVSINLRRQPCRPHCDFCQPASLGVPTAAPLSKMAEDDEAKAPSVGVEPWEQDRPLFYQGDGAEVQRPPPSHHDRFFYKYVRIPAAAPLRGAYVPPSCTVLCPCS